MYNEICKNCHRPIINHQYRDGLWRCMKTGQACFESSETVAVPKKLVESVNELYLHLYGDGAGAVLGNDGWNILREIRSMIVFIKEDGKT